MSSETTIQLLFNRLYKAINFVEITARNTPENVNGAIVTSVRDIFEDSYCAVLYTLTNSGDANDRYVTESISCDPEDVAGRLQPIRAGSGIAEFIIRQNLLVVENVFTYPAIYMDEIETNKKLKLYVDNTFVSSERIRSFVGFRLGEPESPIGILYVNWLETRTFTDIELNVLQMYVYQVSHLIAHQRIREQNRINNSPTRRFEHLVFSLNERKTQIDIHEEIDGLLRQLVEELRDTFLVIKIPLGGWRKYEIDQTSEINIEDLDSPQHNRLLSFAKEIVQFFQSAQNEPTRSYFAWRSKHKLETADPHSYVVAASIRVGETCVGIFFNQVLIPQLFGQSFRKSPQVIRNQSILARYSRQLAAVTRQYDATNALVALRELSIRFAESLDLHEIAEILVSEISKALRSLDALIVCYNDDLTDELFIAQYGLRDPDRFDASDNRLNEVFLASVGASEMEQLLLSSDFCKSERISSVAAYAMRGLVHSTNLRNVGAIFFCYRMQHQFDQEERNLLELFVESASTAFNRALQSRESEREKRHLKIVQELALAIKSLNPDDVMRTILSTISKEFSGIAHNCAFVEYLPTSHRLYIGPVSLNGFYRLDDPPKSGEGFIVNADKRMGLAGMVMRYHSDGDILIECNIKDRSIEHYIEAIKSTQSQLCIRISSTAALIVESDLPDPFNEKEHHALLRLIADFAGIALQKAHEHVDLQRGKEQKWRQEIAVLATGLIHDIRTVTGVIPAAMKEMSDISEDFTSIYSEQIHSVVSAVEGVSRINERLEEFLKTRNFSPDYVTFGELIDTSIQAAINDAPENLEIKTNPRHIHSRVHVDKVWIELLLKNLLLNAYSAISRKDTEGIVEISVKRSKGYWLIRVKDNGVGMHESVWGKIFDPFYTATNPHDRLLHGIGLFYARELAQAHEGTLYVEKSSVGKGTVMCLRLPIKPAWWKING
ncbi:MAG: hypothetical protein KJ065_25755 [Anaerolineae bacterium]|nr:hypothetical protein [Anaerolineae bacterium]